MLKDNSLDQLREPERMKNFSFPSHQSPVTSSLLLILSLAFTLLIGCYHPVAGQNKTELLWDTYGVPHIYAKDSKSLFQAFGWAQMQSHGNLILRLYGQARGKAAEYWGKEYLESDQWVRTMGIPERAQQWYQQQNPTFRGYLDAFAVGINNYAQENSDRIDDKLKAVLPVTGADVLAHGQRVLHFNFVVDPDKVADLTEKWSASQIGMNSDRTDSNSPPRERGGVGGGVKAGSNGWAIAPKHSASGNAMLLANPHLPWSDLYLWYEAQLTAPEIDAYGATLVGFPVLEIAFNNNLGWTHTVNTHDGWDAYELKLSKNGYLWDGKVKPFQTEKQIIKVKQDNGKIKEETLTIKRSIHGAVVQEKDHKAIAIRVVGLDKPNALEQWWDMARANNLAQFESALKGLQIPMFTVMYADREGHIMHLFNGNVPVRSQGDFDYWEGIIPGDTSTTLWTKSHPYQDLPRVVDPASGWLQNANDAPWTTTFPQALNPDNYPAYMAPRESMGLRPQRSAKMLMEDDKISFEELIKYKHSTTMELARLLDDLIPVARKQGNEIARRAADVLEKWDRKADADSQGAVLFASWAQAVDRKKLFATPWNASAPLSTPDGIADPKNAVGVLETVAKKVEANYGALDISWGKVFRLQQGDLDLPGNGADDSLGVFRAVWYAPTEDGQFQAVAGDTFVAAVEFSNPVKAMVLTTYGNSTQPNSTHRNDQLELFANKQLRSVWRKRAEIEAHLESRKLF